MAEFRAQARPRSPRAKSGSMWHVYVISVSTAGIAYKHINLKAKLMLIAYYSSIAGK